MWAQGILLVLASAAVTSLEVSSSRRAVLRNVGSGILGSSSLAVRTGLPSPASAVAAPMTIAAVPPPLVLPPIGIGAWAWGDSVFWGYNPLNDGELSELFDFVASTPNGKVAKA